jgi:hypothetical protein
VLEAAAAGFCAGGGVPTMINTRALIPIDVANHALTLSQLT